jgi:hypothetical protein
VLSQFVCKKKYLNPLNYLPVPPQPQSSPRIRGAVGGRDSSKQFPSVFAKDLFKDMHVSNIIKGYLKPIHKQNIATIAKIKENQLKNKIIIDIGSQLTTLSYKKFIIEQRQLLQVRKIYNEFSGKKTHIFDFLKTLCKYIISPCGGISGGDNINASEPSLAAGEGDGSDFTSNLWVDNPTCQVNPSYSKHDSSLGINPAAFALPTRDQGRLSLGTQGANITKTHLKRLNLRLKTMFDCRAPVPRDKRGSREKRPCPPLLSAGLKTKVRKSARGARGWRRKYRLFSFKRKKARSKALGFTPLGIPLTPLVFTRKSPRGQARPTHENNPHTTH